MSHGLCRPQHTDAGALGQFERDGDRSAEILMHRSASSVDALDLTKGTVEFHRVLAAFVQAEVACPPGQRGDGPADFTSDRIDVAFRDGRADDSQVVAKPLIPMQMIVCASPACASAHGLPRTVEEIDEHRCINFRTASGRIVDWEFKVGGVSRKVSHNTLHTFNDADLVLQSVLDGHGIAQLAAYPVSGLLREGRLHACLAQHPPDNRGSQCVLSQPQAYAGAHSRVDRLHDRADPGLSIWNVPFKCLRPCVVDCCYRDNTVSAFAGLLPLDEHAYDLS
jgi:LysR substrate binding domain